jgi:hypothetical protein
LLSPIVRAETEPSVSETDEPEEESDAGLILLGVLVFLGGGAFIGWVVWHHLKYTVKGTVARVEVLKEAVAGAKEEIKIANERKKNGQGWTLPPDYARNNTAGGKEEIVFGYTRGYDRASQPLAQVVPANGEAVSGAGGETKEDGRKERVGSPVVAVAIMLTLTGLLALGGALLANQKDKIKTYPTTQAQVVKCREVMRTDDDGENEYIDYYRVDIQYAVEGKNYWQYEKSSKSPLAGIVTVYYKPGKPGDVYFEEDVKDYGFYAEFSQVVYLFAGLAGAYGLWLFVGYRIKMRKLKREQ